MTQQVELLMADLDRYTERTIVELSLNITSNLQEETPRDTSWARANWIPSVGQPKLLPQVSDPDSGDVARARGAGQTGLAEVVGYKLNKGSVFASNGVPYLEQLNQGSSNQAPAGFVQREIERGVKQTTGRRRR